MMTADPLDSPIRHALRAIADDIAPSSPPLTTIRRRGRLRRRRRAAALAGTYALVLAATGGVVASALPDHEGDPIASHTSIAPANPGGPQVRVVKAGEHVTIAPGVELWLDSDGYRWTDDVPGVRFHSVVDGNVDRSDPGVQGQLNEPVNQMEQDGPHLILRMFNGGVNDASDLSLFENDGIQLPDPADGTVVMLPGNPGWGVWYDVVPADRVAEPLGGTDE
jgi:hypothetical protein